MSPTAILMSIKPEYAELIFAGRKTIELRRVCPKIKKGDLVIVYVSGPRMALVGGFSVEGVISSSVHGKAQDWLVEACVSKQAFELYFKGASMAYGIKIGKTWQFPVAKELSLLRRRKGGFQPPQSYRYVRSEELNTFLKYGGSHLLMASHSA